MLRFELLTNGEEYGVICDIRYCSKLQIVLFSYRHVFNI
jgi:hypothetical protein